MATNETPQQQPQPQGGPAGGGFSISGKTLAVAGGGAAALVAVIVVVVLAVTGAFGGGGVSGGGNRAGLCPRATPDWSPSATSGPKPAATAWRTTSHSSRTGGDDPRDTRDIGMDDDHIELFAVVYETFGGDDTLWIAKGDFEFDDIREELDDGLDCDDDDYRGFEMWECAGRGLSGGGGHL